MGKNKTYCKKCEKKHYPPTGKNCVLCEPQHEVSGLRSSVVKDKKKVTSGKKGVQQKDNSPSTSGIKIFDPQQFGAKSSDVSTSGSELETSTSEVEQETVTSVQTQILRQLQKVSERLDTVEQRVAENGPAVTSLEKQSKGKRRKDMQKLSSTSKHSKCTVYQNVKSKHVISDESSDDTEIPDICELRSSKRVQKKVDDRISQLERSTSSQGTGSKIKSKRGGNIDVFVEKKVAWPQDVILGGANRQRVSYDQLSLTQFVQGFVRNVVEENDQCVKDKMLLYLSDLMEDATDFAWVNAKAAHAVVLCEMERGVLDWHDTDRLDRLRRAHAQKHVTQIKHGISKTDARRPWYCKQFQSGNCHHIKDHEFGGKVFRHICAFCITLGKQYNHPEKDCQNAKRNAPKNELRAAQQ